MDIKWFCEKCGSENIDDFQETCMPTCSECLEVYFWDDILEPDVMDAANEELKEKSGA
jgi:hypothetical protein